MRDFILVVTPLIFQILSVLFLNKYFKNEPSKRNWLNLWYGLVFLLITFYMYLYVLIDALFL